MGFIVLGKPGAVHRRAPGSGRAAGVVQGQIAPGHQLADKNRGVGTVVLLQLPQHRDKLPVLPGMISSGMNARGRALCHDRIQPGKGRIPEDGGKPAAKRQQQNHAGQAAGEAPDDQLIRQIQHHNYTHHIDRNPHKEGQRLRIGAQRHGKSHTDSRELKANGKGTALSFQIQQKHTGNGKQCVGIVCKSRLSPAVTPERKHRTGQGNQKTGQTAHGFGQESVTQK